MNAVTIQLIEGVLEELWKTKSTSASVIGPLKDSAIVVASTYIGGFFGGPLGVVVGAVAGTGILGISKALGYGNYKPLMTALREDFSEQERNILYARLWEIFKSYYLPDPLAQATYSLSAVNELIETIRQNPELMRDVENELAETFDRRRTGLNLQ